MHRVVSTLWICVLAIGLTVDARSDDVTTGLLTYSTQQHAISSQLDLSIYLGYPPTDGILLSTVSANPLIGTLRADVTLDDLGNGFIRFQDSSLIMQDVNNLLLDVGQFGTALGSLHGVRLSFSSGDIAVHSHQFVFDGSSIVLSANEGIVLLSDPTGPLAALFGGMFPIIWDLQQQPVISYGNTPYDGLKLATGTVDLGGDFFDGDGEVNIDIPSLIVKIAGGGGGMPNMFMTLSGSAHVAVPELGSLAFCGIVLAGMSSFMGRRRCRGMTRTS